MHQTHPIPNSLNLSKIPVFDLVSERGRQGGREAGRQGGWEAGREGGRERGRRETASVGELGHS